MLDTKKHEHVQHRALGRGSSCMSDCSNAALQGTCQSEALLKCSGSPDCFDSDLQLFGVVGSDVSHLPRPNSP